MHILESASLAKLGSETGHRGKPVKGLEGIADELTLRSTKRLVSIPVTTISAIRQR